MRLLLYCGCLNSKIVLFDIFNSAALECKSGTVSTFYFNSVVFHVKINERTKSNAIRQIKMNNISFALCHY